MGRRISQDTTRGVFGRAASQTKHRLRMLSSATSEMVLADRQYDFDCVGILPGIGTPELRGATVANMAHIRFPVQLIQMCGACFNLDYLLDLYTNHN